MLDSIPAICWFYFFSRLSDREAWELVCKLAPITKNLYDIFTKIKDNDRFESLRKIYIPIDAPVNIIQSTMTHIAKKYNSSQKWIVYMSDNDGFMRNAYHISKMIIDTSQIFNIALRFNSSIHRDMLWYTIPRETIFYIDPDRISSLDIYSIRLFDLTHQMTNQKPLLLFLEKTTQLTSLDLSRNMNFCYNLRLLVPIIAKMPQLTYLNLTSQSCRPFNNNNEDDIALLASIEIPKLTTLNISECDLKGREKYVYQLLITKPNLTSLDLSRTFIDDFSQMNQCFEKMKGLQSLNLSHNYISTPVAKSIIESIIKLQHIKEIDLSHNSIGSDGAIYIISFLGRMSQLKVLNLQDNSIHKRTKYMLKHRIKSYRRDNMTVSV